MRNFKKIFVLSVFLISSCQGGTPSSLTSIASSESEISSVQSYKEEPLDISLEKEILLPNEVYSLSKYENIEFSVDDEQIASIDEEKNLHALKEGSFVLTARNSENPYQIKKIQMQVKARTGLVDYRYYDLDSYPTNRRSLDSKGTQNVLVIPVNIKDFDDYATKENLEKINKAFNGMDNNKWESVKSFYLKSSYNQLNLNFMVADEWFDLGLNPVELLTHDSYGDGGADYVSERALAWYKEKYHPSENVIDQNQDGYVDAIWLIYDAPNYSNYDYASSYKGIDDSSFWAFTAENYSHYQKDDGRVGSSVVKIYSWASMDFIDNYNQEGTIDAHTYIHETGHLFGLNDYYNTYGSKNQTPLGCIDMMDNNIGDHCAFSKFALGWIKPTVINETTTIELSPYEESGQFLLVTGDNYNNSAFDEYFTIEYITPTYLNELDYTNTYENNGIQGYSKPGIRIIHVDSRLQDINEQYTDKVEEGVYDMISNTNYIGATNYYDIDKTSALFQLTLMQKNIATAKASVLSYGLKYRTGIKNKEIDPNDSLFHKGDFFHLTKTSQYNALMPSYSNKLDRYGQSGDDNDTFNYRIKVENMDEKKAVISILKIK